MLDWTQRSAMLPRAATQNGRRGWLIGTRFIPVMAGGEDDDPPKDDPKPGDPPKDDDDDFDKERALATIRKLREKEKAGQATQKQLDDALARLKAIEDKDKSETEKLAGQAREASEKLTAAEARAQDLAIRLAVERAARKLHFIDEDDAVRLLDRKAVETDDDGEPANVEKLLEALAKQKPHLVQADAGDGTKQKTAEKSPPPTPKPNGKAPTRDELVEKAKEELRASGRYSF